MIRVKNIVLRKIDEADVENNWAAFLSLRNDVDTALQILSRPLGQNREDILAWIRSRSARLDCIFLGIFKGDGFLGYVMFTEECRISGVGELSITLAAEARGQGVAADVLEAFIAYLFDALDYSKFYARILATNAASVRLFRQAGFSLVGVLHRHRRMRGQYVDVELYEKLLR